MGAGKPLGVGVDAPLAGALGLALHWIHIYLRPLHRMLQLFWLLGCIGWIGLNLQVGVDASLTTLAANPLWIFAIGPLFAAPCRRGFREFFCFRRPEAIGLTLLLPVSLLGRLVGIDRALDVVCLDGHVSGTAGGAVTAKVRHGGGCRCRRQERVCLSS